MRRSNLFVDNKMAQSASLPQSPVFTQSEFVDFIVRALDQETRNRLSDIVEEEDANKRQILEEMKKTQQKERVAKMEEEMGQTWLMIGPFFCILFLVGAKFSYTYNNVLCFTLIAVGVLCLLASLTSYLKMKPVLKKKNKKTKKK